MDFTQLMDNGYMIPTSIAVGSGEPTDIRCVCATVEDFKDFFDTTGMDLRYEGLITYEKDTKTLKVYKGNEIWEDVINYGSSDDIEIDLSEYATKLELDKKADKEELHNHSNLELLETITNEKIEKWNNKSDFSGNYEDLINTPNIPTKLSELENDKGFLTEHQDITGKVDKVEGYSLVLDSEIERLSELRNYDDTELKELINTKSDFSGSYDDLTNKPEILTIDNVNDKVNEKTIFKTDLLTITNFGGIPAGSDLNGLSVLEILTKLLYPYIAPSLYIETYPDGGLYEYGDTKTITNVKVVITKKSEKIKKLEIFNGSELIEIIEDTTIENGGTFNYTVNIPANTDLFKISARITDNLGETVSSNSNTFKYVYPYYHGVCGIDTNIDETLVYNLNKYVSTKGTKTILYNTNDERMIYAYPKAYGVLSKIEDANNFDATATFDFKEIQLSCLDGTIQDYYVYYNDSSTLKNFSMEFFH